MHPFSPRRFVALLPAAAVVLVGCSASSDGDAPDVAASALGERWRSPLVPGIYETADWTIRVANRLQGQNVAVTGGSSLGYWEGSVSVDGGSAVLSSYGTQFVITPSAQGLLLRFQGGDQRWSYGRPIPQRQPNALVGTYRRGANRNDGTLEILSTSEEGMTIRRNGKALQQMKRSGGFLGTEEVYHEDGFWGACSLRVVRLGPSGHQLSLGSEPDEKCDDAEFLGPYHRDTRG